MTNHSDSDRLLVHTTGHNSRLALTSLTIVSLATYHITHFTNPIFSQSDPDRQLLARKIKRAKVQSEAGEEDKGSDKGRENQINIVRPSSPRTLFNILAPSAIIFIDLIEEVTELFQGESGIKMTMRFETMDLSRYFKLHKVVAVSRTENKFPESCSLIDKHC